MVIALPVSAISAPYDCALRKVVDHVEGARILRQAKHIPFRHAQDLCQSNSNHSGVGDNQGAATSICRDNVPHLQIYPLLEIAEKLGAGDRPQQKVFRPLMGKLREASRNLLPRESLPLSEVHLPQPGPNLHFEPELSRDSLSTLMCTPEVARVNGSDRKLGTLLNQRMQLLPASSCERDIPLTRKAPITFRRGVPDQEQAANDRREISLGF
jgi:hypothetical protein